MENVKEIHTFSILGKGINWIKKTHKILDSFVLMAVIDFIIKLIQWLFIFEKVKIKEDFIINIWNMFSSEGFIKMFFFSLIIRYIFILIYDCRKKDYFLIEQIKEKIGSVKNKFSEKIEKHKKSGKLVIFIIITFYQPIFMVIYYREGSYKWNGIPSIKILSYFLLSIFLCSVSLFTVFTIWGMKLELLHKILEFLKTVI